MTENSGADIEKTVQENYAPAQKIERDWSLYLFFRILPMDEVNAAIQAIKDAKGLLEFKAIVEEQTHLRVDGALVDENEVSVDTFPTLKTTDRYGETTAEDPNPRAPFLRFLQKLLGLAPPEMEDTINEYARWLELTLPNDGASADERAAHWFHLGLPGMCVHECLRYEQGCARNGRPLLRNGQSSAETSCAPATPEYSNAAVNIAFTHGGLGAIKKKLAGSGEQQLIEGMVLDSFPDAFRQGMAARAKTLGDAGRSAPEYWDGELGKRSIHGLLTAYFDITEANPKYWNKLRDEVEDFNKGDLRLRVALSMLFRPFGFEVVHIELGEDPYTVSENELKRCKPRVEHFGFRDGISQPFVNLNAKTPRRGGGRPAMDGTWAPVARGELYLGVPDEDGLTADQPVNTVLREGGTYLVFRKLEQDVAGFRTFLASQRETPQGQHRLAAQMVGRWRNGAPLVRHPNAEAAYEGPRADGDINDFRYFTEDPQGQKCPIGAHIRRANPRDTGGRDDVKRHRLLRRGMAYGGALLEGSVGDGRQRGLLFVAANSRVELQFEVIQRDWLNRGELLGQVGAGRCPLTGSNRGGVHDRFLEAGAIAPICGIPSFVTTKGGDYFFVPSIKALQALSQGELIEVERTILGRFSAARTETTGLLSEAILKTYSMEILASYKCLPPTPNSEAPSECQFRSAIRVRMPDELRETGRNVPGGTMVFVGHYDDVVEVLGGHMPHHCRATGGMPRTDLNFSVAHYLQASREITRGGNLLLAMDPSGPLDDARKRRLQLMKDAWDAQSEWTDLSNGNLRRFIGETVDGIEHRVAQTGRIDILQDLAFYIPYRIIQQYVGLSGPEYLSELVVAMPFAKRNVMSLPGDWLTGRKDMRVAEPGYATMQMWARLAFGDVIGNIWRKREMAELATQATSEMLTYIDEKIAEERQRQLDDSSTPKTLLAQLVRLAPAHDYDAHFAEVRIILADVITTIAMNIALPFSKAIQGALEFQFDLHRLLQLLEPTPTPDTGRLEPETGRLSHRPDIVQRLGYELLRLFPSAPAIFRRCETTTELPSGAKIHKGEWVAALLGVAGRDPRIFPQPNKFSLGRPPSVNPNSRGRNSRANRNTPDDGQSDWPERDPEKYLLFGPPCGAHRCWGQPLGSVVMGELFRAAARFEGLTRIAGPNGEIFEFPPRMDYGLRLKFYPYDPNRPKKSPIRAPAAEPG